MGDLVRTRRFSGAGRFWLAPRRQDQRGGAPRPYLDAHREESEAPVALAVRRVNRGSLGVMVRVGSGVGMCNKSRLDCFKEGLKAVWRRRSSISKNFMLQKDISPCDVVGCVYEFQEGGEEDR